MSARTVLRGARWPGDIAIADGVIVEAGVVEPQPDDVVVNVDGDIITAGLANTHHHLYQWMTRGRAVGCDLFGWLVELYPVWGRLSVDDVAAAALVGLGELAATGCTSASDHHYLVPHGDDAVFDAIVEAAATVGIRLHLSRGSMDLGESQGGLPPDHVVEDLDSIMASTERVIAQHHDGDMVHVVVAPCSPFSVSSELMEASAALARQHGLRLHTHLCETIDEQEHCLERFGRRPVEQLDDWGWVGDDVWLAHGIWINDEEIVRLGAAGVGVAHCPSSNARLAAGTCRVTDLKPPVCRLVSGWTAWLPTRWAACSLSYANRCTPPGCGQWTPAPSCPMTHSAWVPRAEHAASECPTAWARSNLAWSPTLPCGPATTSPTWSIPWPGWCSAPTAGSATSTSAATPSSKTASS